MGYNPRADGAAVLNRRLPRRAVRLNAGDVPPPWLEAAVAGLFDSEQAPPIDLDALKLPARHLDKGQRETLRTIADLLTAEGQAAFGVRVLEPCVLGWAALCGVAPEALLLAMIQVAMDYLACAETLGLTIPDWRSRVAPALDLARAHPDAPGNEIFAASWAAGEQAATARAAERKHTERARADEGLGLVGARGEMVAVLQLAHDKILRVPEAHRVKAEGLRRQLRSLREHAGDAKLLASLEDVRIQASPILAEAHRLSQGIDAAKAEHAGQTAATAEALKRQKSDERARARRNREHAKAVREQKANDKAALTPVRAAARKLEGLCRRSPAGRGKPLETLRELRVDGRPVIERAPTPADARPSLLDGAMVVVDFLNDIIRPEARADHAPDPGWWRSAYDPGVVVHSAQLERWGPGVREVLAPALRALHAEEDRLVRAAGVAPRADRPVIEGPRRRGQAVRRPGWSR